MALDAVDGAVVRAGDLERVGSLLQRARADREPELREVRVARHAQALVQRDVAVRRAIGRVVAHRPAPAIELDADASIGQRAAVEVTLGDAVGCAFIASGGGASSVPSISGVSAS